MDDDTYTFHNVYIPVVTRTTGGGEDAHKVQDVVATAWLNFAKTGSPSQDGLEWKPYTEDEQNTMVLKEESECRDLGDETLRGLIMSGGYGRVSKWIVNIRLTHRQLNIKLSWQGIRSVDFKTCSGLFYFQKQVYFSW